MRRMVMVAILVMAVSGVVVGQDEATETPQPPTIAITALAWSPDGSKIAYGSTAKVVEIIDALTLEPLQFRNFDEVPIDIAWQFSGDEIAVALFNGSVAIWDLDSNIEGLIDSVPNQDFFPLISDIAINADGLLAIAYSGPPFQFDVYDLETFAEISVPTYLIPETMIDDGLYAVAWAPSGNQLAVGGLSGVAIFDFTDRKFSFIDWWGIAMDWSPDGEKLLVAGGGEWKVWDFRTGTMLHRVYGSSPLESYRRTLWHFDNDLFIAGKYGGSIEFWSSSSEQLLEAIDAEMSEYSPFDWSPDGTQIAFGGADVTGNPPQVVIVDAPQLPEANATPSTDNQ
jgi:WD40 repeat protein